MRSGGRRRGSKGPAQIGPGRLQVVEGRLINVRRLVSLDIVLHGERFILAEFGIGTPALFIIGFSLTMYGLSLPGLYFLLTGVNYLPLLAYAIVITRRHSAKSDVETEMSSDRHYVRKYSVQQLLLFLPLVVAFLASAQFLRKE